MKGESEIRVALGIIGINKMIVIEIGLSTGTMRIWRMKLLEAPDSDDIYDSHILSDWLAYMDNYFEWYNMSNERRVRFARKKLQWSTKIF